MSEEIDNLGVLVSPNDMMTAAKKYMLGGREPESKKDWMMVVNFIAANTHRSVARVAVPLICGLYEVPLPACVIDEIVEYQLARVNMNN